MNTDKTPNTQAPWRQLEPGEVIQDGDEGVYVIHNTGEKSWRKCPRCVGTTVYPWELGTFRTRRPHPAAEPPCNGQCNHGGENCGAYGPRAFICTLPLGHKGEHIACGERDHKLVTWPNKDDKPAAEPPWRALEPGEMIQEGDEVERYNGRWAVQTKCTGQPNLGCAPFRTRRPLPSAPPIRVNCPPYCHKCGTLHRSEDGCNPSAPPDSGQAGNGNGGARLAKMLVDDATFAGVLAECDNRKLLWLAMQTKAWMDTEILGKDAAILAEVESRLYPEYDGDKVKMTEWGWDVCGGQIRYVPSGTPTEPEPAPAQTAREWVRSNLRHADYPNGGFFDYLSEDDAIELADMHDAQKARADSAEALANEWKIEAVESTNALEEAVTACAQIAAERDRLRERVKELEDTERRALFASAISDAHMELKAERDRLREALEDIAKKCGDFNSTPIGPTTITNIAREALNQTTNEK